MKHTEYTGLEKLSQNTRPPYAGFRKVEIYVAEGKGGITTFLPMEYVSAVIPPTHAPSCYKCHCTQQLAIIFFFPHAGAKTFKFTSAATGWDS